MCNKNVNRTASFLGWRYLDCHFFFSDVVTIMFLSFCDGVYNIFWRISIRTILKTEYQLYESDRRGHFNPDESLPTPQDKIVHLTGGLFIVSSFF